MQLQYSAYFECVLQEEAHIRDPYFKVTIPTLFPSVENKYTASENQDDITLGETLNKKASPGKKMTSTTTILAKNHTDYHFQLKGDVFKDRYEAIEGITEKSQDPSPDGSADDIIAHDHDLKKALSIFNFFFENLNNVTVPAGTKAYGFFINGTYDTESFVVVRIEGAVPLKKDDIIKYVK